MPKYTQTFAPKATAKSPSPYKDDPSDEWSRFMYTGMGSNGTQYNPVTAYTIILYDGSNPEYEQLMKNVSVQSGTTPYFVKLGDTDGLNAALAGIIRQVMAANSVFAAPVLPVSANTQGTYANQVFMGMFRPDSSALPRWVGNLKQYQFGADLSDPLKPVLFLADAMGKPALSAAGTGFLDPSAVSFWTSKNAGSLPDSADGFWKNAVAAQGATDGFDSADGHIVERGGVSQQIRLAHLTASVNAAASPATLTAAHNLPAVVSVATSPSRLAASALMTLAALALLTRPPSDAPTYSVHCDVRFCSARPTVGGSLLNSPATTSAWPLRAFMTTSAVNAPWLAILRSSPVVTPSPLARAWARRGACSITELNSSPRNTPDCRP